MANNENLSNPDLCKACGGKCCNSLPGAAAPEDFGNNKDDIQKAVRTALLSGNWELDKWDGWADIGLDDEVEDSHFIRPKCVGNKSVFHYSWGNSPCAFLKEDGCTLQPGQRPFECRLLEPRKNPETGEHACKSHYKHKLSVIALWIKSGVNLYQIGREVQLELKNQGHQNG